MRGIVEQVVCSPNLTYILVDAEAGFRQCSCMLGPRRGLFMFPSIVPQPVGSSPAVPLHASASLLGRDLQHPRLL